MTWAQQGTTQTITMGATIHAGLVVNSHVAGTLNTSTLDNVSFDTTAPSADFTIPNEGATATQASTTVTPTWAETDGQGIGVSSRSLQRWSGAPSTPVPAPPRVGAPTAPRSRRLPGEPVRATHEHLLQVVQTLTDYAGNAAASTSGFALIDTSAPSLPTVTGSGTNVYQAAANSPVYFKAGGSGTISLSSTATDGESGISKHNYGALSAPTGWTFSAGTWPEIRPSRPRPGAERGTTPVTSRRTTERWPRDPRGP